MNPVFPPIQPADRWEVAPGVLHRVVGDEVFLLMPDSRVHWLKQASARGIWECVARGARPDLLAIVTELTARFDAEPATIEVDALEFLNELETRGALRRVR